MRERTEAEKESAKSDEAKTGDETRGATQANGGRGWEGTVAKATQLTPGAFVDSLRHAKDPPAIGAVLDAAHRNGELKQVVSQLSTTAQFNVLVPALRLLRYDPLAGGRREALKDVFDGTPDTFRITLALCLSIRFRIDHVGLDSTPDGSIRWDARGLRRAWSVLEALPPDAVERNPELDAFLREDGHSSAGAGGYYMESQKKIGWSYNPDLIAKRDNAGFATPCDPLYDKNEFDSGVRHEVGHAVDAATHASDRYTPTLDGGGWKVFGDAYDVVDEVSEATGLHAAIAANTPLLTKVTAALHFYASYADLDDLQTCEASIRGDASLAAPSTMWAPWASTVRLLGTVYAERNRAWSGDVGGTAKLGGRVYTLDGEVWSSYAESARQKKVSNYQFRSTAEWYAEAYAAYYDPGGKKRGDVLRSIDPATADFIAAEERKFQAKPK